MRVEVERLVEGNCRGLCEGWGVYFSVVVKKVRIGMGNSLEVGFIGFVDRFKVCKGKRN